MMKPSKPHFFQPLLPGFELQFSIPEAFYKKYFNGGRKKKKGGGGGDKTIVLRTRGGKVHEVRVSGREFKDGWREFVEEHDLHVGDFVVFRLEREMTFHVMVFDPTVCERQYNDVVSSAPATQDQVPAAAAGGGNVFVDTVVEEVQTPVVEEETNNGGFWLETPKASLVAAEANKPSFDFTARADGRVYIPMKFARENGLAGNRCATIVMDGKGRPWPTRLVSYQNSTCTVQMGHGWGEFQKNNGVRLGDSLKVELVQGGLMPVFRISGFGMRRTEKEPVHEESPAAAVAVSSRDSVNVEVVQDGLKPASKVPELDPNPKKKTKEIEKEVKQEPVYEESAAAAAAAESTKDRNSYLTVNLTEELDPNPKKDSMEIETEVKQEPVHEESAAAAAVPSKVVDSYFTVHLTEGYLKGGFLNIPQDFAIKNGLHGISVSLMLANHVGTTFLVGLKTSKTGRPYIGSGWREVVELNHFRMGDVLRFDLVESGPNPVMNFKVL